MNIDLSKPWKEVFALVAEVKAEEKRKKHEEELVEELDRQDREKHVEDDKREKKEKEEKAFEQMLATTERLDDFSSKLDDLDTASVHALMTNGEALDRVQAQLGSMLDKADKLPDGRRMFKTEDGNLPHFKLKLRDVARSLYLEHGWLMPAGLANSTERDPRNFTREQWQQAKRADKDPRELQEAFQDCWAMSDSGKAFAQALESRGLYLARGDRRGFVALDIKGEVYSIPKWTGLKTRQVEARIGYPATLRSVDETRAYIAGLLSGVLGRHLTEAEQKYEEQRAPLIAVRAARRIDQRRQRGLLLVHQRQQAEAEARRRASRFRTGIRGLWDRLTGRSATIRRENEADALAMCRRHGDERQAISRAQLAERRQLFSIISGIDSAYRAERDAIHREKVALAQPASETPAAAEAAPRPPRMGQRRHRTPSP